MPKQRKPTYNVYKVLLTELDKQILISCLELFEFNYNHKGTNARRKKLTKFLKEIKPVDRD